MQLEYYVQAFLTTLGPVFLAVGLLYGAGRVGKWIIGKGKTRQESVEDMLEKADNPPHVRRLD